MSEPADQTESPGKRAARFRIPGVAGIRSHWRGDATLWKAVFVFSLLVSAIVYAGAYAWLKRQVVLATPASRMTQLTIIVALAVAIAIWQLVGTWRASAKGRPPPRWWITRWSARVFALLMTLPAVPLLLAYPPTMQQLALQATDQDEFGRNGYSISVEDNTLFITGSFTWGLLSAVSRELDANSGITSVVLNSLGGHVGVGAGIYELVKARNLDTYAVEQCSSACILAFLAGSNRYLQRGAKLGFHAVAGDNEAGEAVGTERIVAIYRAAGLPDDFIEQVLRVPSASVWYPKVTELMEANVVTELVN